MFSAKQNVGGSRSTEALGPPLNPFIRFSNTKPRSVLIPFKFKLP